MIAAGNPPPRDVISQTELKGLAALERKAARLREKLRGRLGAGWLVEPGPLSLG